MTEPPATAEIGVTPAPASQGRVWLATRNGLVAALFDVDPTCIG